MWDFPLFPDKASALAARVDTFFFVWLTLAGIIALSIACVIVFFSIKYRQGSAADRDLAAGPGQERRQRRIELAWTLTPLAIFLAMFVWAARLYYEHANAPDDALEIYVVGQQWMWILQHAGGQREIDELHIPAGRPVKLVMTSQDVIHDFSLPVLRIKQDVLPGRYTSLWFTATKPGDYRIFCSQYCGTDHSRMIGRVVVLAPAEFERWLEGTAAPQTMAAQGGARFREYGCSGCHGPSASVHAPKLEGLFGRPVQLADGTTVVADERYIRDSVLLPDKEIVAGYAPIMPSFRGQIGEDELQQVIEYIKSLRDAPRGEAR
jgi:cytochrome c oxidase subunit 2